MLNKSPHTFHIPVMGLGYTVDTPLKVGRYGISSVVSIIEDQLLERMREFHCHKENDTYEPIVESDPDHRAKRITAYLNLINKILNRQVEKLKSSDFSNGSELVRYFEMLPDLADAKIKYHEMKNAASPEKEMLQEELKKYVVAGAIDVNIMTKLDKMNFNKSGEALPVEYCDAMAALRGFALSDLSSSVIFSAGLNPRLYSYIETFGDFYQNEAGQLKKKIILKVSDYRSALIQGKMLVKKGLWVSEFRIESGLNCGGHAFATEGLLMGPILQEFKEKRETLFNELLLMCNIALVESGRKQFTANPGLRITYQGGLGTAVENDFLMDYYSLDSTGWGSPFLLVPEATNVDDETLNKLAHAEKDDYFLSNASPLGVPFNNFKRSSSEVQRKMRIEKGRPGSPCYKKFLTLNTEFTDKPICSASREYQNLKIREVMQSNLTKGEQVEKIQAIEEKDCLCEGLGAAALLKNRLIPSHHLTAVTICPGPNLAYFSGIFSLESMVGHIYGKLNILNSQFRPDVFTNELILYVNYLKQEVNKFTEELTLKQNKYLSSFKHNLECGIGYYKNLLDVLRKDKNFNTESFSMALDAIEEDLKDLVLPSPSASLV